MSFEEGAFWNLENAGLRWEIHKHNQYEFHLTFFKFGLAIETFLTLTEYVSRKGICEHWNCFIPRWKMRYHKPYRLHLTVFLFCCGLKAFFDTLKIHFLAVFYFLPVSKSPFQIRSARINKAAKVPVSNCVYLFERKVPVKSKMCPC